MTFRHKKYCAFIFLIGLCAAALDLKPHLEWQPLDEVQTPSKDSVETKETPVDINGIRYREIEVSGEKFYLKFLNKEASLQDDTDCLRQGADVNPFLEPLRVYGEHRIVKRTRAFIEGLRVKCQKVSSFSAEIKDVNVGIAVKNDDNTKDKVYVNPMAQQIGISHEDLDQHRGKSLGLTPGGASGSMEW